MDVSGKVRARASHERTRLNDPSKKVQERVVKECLIAPLILLAQPESCLIEASQLG